MSVPGQDNAVSTLAADPFTSLNVHFGMLLGVDDLDTLAGTPRGKMRLHNAWLHGTGVVWGLDVSFDPPSGEVRVETGLAIDGVGREIPVDQALCLRLLDWFTDNRDDPNLNVVDEGAGVVVFDVLVIAEANACLTRPVPSIGTPCDDDGIDTAYSRTKETVHMRLVPVPAATGTAAPYPRSRLWWGLRSPDTGGGPATVRDQLVVDQLDTVAALPQSERGPAARAALEAFLRDDVAELRPAQDVDGNPTHYPVPPEGAVVLAALRNIRFGPDGEGFQLIGVPDVDSTVRQVLLPTSLMQEVLSHQGTTDTSAAVGPQIVEASLALNGDEISFDLTEDVLSQSIDDRAFVVSVFDPTAGWSLVSVTATDNGAANNILLTLASTPASGHLVRLEIVGTGATPLLGAGNRPFAGAQGSASAGASGRNFTSIISVP